MSTPLGGGRFIVHDPNNFAESEKRVRFKTKEFIVSIYISREKVIEMKQRIVDVSSDIIFSLKNGVSSKPLFLKIQFPVYDKQPVSPAKDGDGFTYHDMLKRFFRCVATNDKAKANRIKKYCESGNTIFRHEPKWELKGSRKTFDIPGANRKKDALKAYYAYDSIWFPVIFTKYIHEDFCKLLRAPGIKMEDQVFVWINPKIKT